MNWGSLDLVPSPTRWRKRIINPRNSHVLFLPLRTFHKNKTHQELEQEVASLKTKLKQAITKGKNIEADRNALRVEIESLKQQVADGATQPSASKDPDLNAVELKLLRDKITQLQSAYESLETEKVRYLQSLLFPPTSSSRFPVHNSLP